MLLSTGSQISVNRDKTITRDHRSRLPPPPSSSARLRNPHDGRNEGKTLALFYDQHKQRLASSGDQSARSETSVEFVDSDRKKREEDKKVEEKKKEGAPLVMKQSTALPSQTNATEDPLVFLRIDAMENQEADATAVAEEPSMGDFVVRCEESFGRSKDGGEPGVSSESGKSGSRILVFVRVRPMAKKEKEARSWCCVRIADRKEVYLTKFPSESDHHKKKRFRGHRFCFDASFPDSTTQQEVYSTTTANLVEGVLQGRNGSVFCYGTTGTGKTYTMLGTVENPGVMVLAIKDLFSKIRQRSYDGNHSVHLSYLEVYNETVRDLLSPGRPLVLRQDKQGIIAAGLTQYRAYSIDEIMGLLQQGNRNRTTEPTQFNETSSRSHAILQVVAEYRAKESGSLVSRVGKISFIDLAGSEKALTNEQRCTQRSLEGANINRSLLSLSSCIHALVEGKKHIPYRNSKLTQLLKDSLGGSCNTVMIANISPSNLSFGETQNTLHWADRAKEIKTKASSANEEIILVPESETEQAKLLLELQKENSKLRQQLVRHQQELLTIQAQLLAAKSSPAPPAISSSLLPLPCSAELKKSTVDDAVVQELQNKVKALEAEIEELNMEHMLLIKQKDDFIYELMNKNSPEPLEEEEKRVITTEEAAAAAAAAAAVEEGESKSPSHHSLSPEPTAKKRSFWNKITDCIPLPVAADGRMTRSHVAAEAPPAPSMLLQFTHRCFWYVLMLGPRIAKLFLAAGL